MRPLLPAFVLSLSLAFAGACAAQSSAVTIEQIGNGNSAFVHQ
jgi:hypothetical protein